MAVVPPNSFFAGINKVIMNKKSFAVRRSKKSVRYHFPSSVSELLRAV